MLCSEVGMSALAEILRNLEVSVHRGGDPGATAGAGGRAPPPMPLRPSLLGGPSPPLSLPAAERTELTVGGGQSGWWLTHAVSRSLSFNFQRRLPGTIHLEDSR